MNLESIYNYIFPKKKLHQMSDDEALTKVTDMIFVHAREVFEDEYFRNATNYYMQDDFFQTVYYHEVICGYLGAVKLLLIDFQDMNRYEDVYTYVIDNLHEPFKKEIRTMVNNKEGSDVWISYIDAKERNIKTEMEKMRKRLVKDSSERARFMINEPINVIIRATAIDTFYTFTAEGRGDPDDQKLAGYLLDKHTDLFYEIKNLVV